MKAVLYDAPRAGMTSFGAAIDALQTGCMRTDGTITHLFALEHYGQAFEALGTYPFVRKVVITA